jgi:hypothetical protein
MAVTVEFYRDTYGGIAYDDIEALLKRAEMVVYCVISQEPEAEWQTVLYNYAVCAQAEFIGSAGGVEEWVSEGSSGGSVTIGSFSCSAGGSSTGSGGGKAKSGLCPQTEMYLEKAGLLYRGAVVL